MKPTITAIFFDIGGTLRVTHSDAGRDLTKIQEMIDFLGEKTTPEDFISKVHRGEKSYRRAFKPSFVELCEGDLWTRFILPEYPPDFIRQNAIKLNQLWRESNRKFILPDMAETLKALGKRGYRLGLISNTTSSVEGYQILEETGLKEYFSTVILSAEFGRRKPHPSLFLTAAREAEVHPSQCAYVGDRPSRDLMGALQSGYGETVIINADGYTPDAFDPDDYDPEKDTGLVMKPDHWIGQLRELLDIYPDLKNTASGASSSDLKPTTYYDAALSTMWAVDQHVSFNKALTLAKKAGLMRVELNHKVSPQQLEKFDKDHFYVSTVHDPCPAVIPLDELKHKDIMISSLDETCRKKAVDITKQSIDLACQFGSRSVVIHPGNLVCDSSRDRQLRKKWEAGLRNTTEYNILKDEMIADRAMRAPAHLDSVLKSLEDIVAYTRGTGVAIGLENRYRYYDIPILDEMEQLLSVCDENWYGFQYDSGHAYTLGALGLCDHEEWLRRFGKRMIGAHLHDVKGITDHQAPGSGDMDFKMISTYLPANACLTIEVGAHLNIDEIVEGLEVLVKSGCINIL